MSKQQPTDAGEVVTPANKPAPDRESKTPAGLIESAPVVLLLIAVHLVLTGVNIPYYFELVRNGLVSMTLTVLAMLGWIFLYLGGIQNARQSKSSGILWVIAAVFLALAICMLDRHMVYMPGSQVVLGFFLALAGWWTVRQTRKKNGLTN